MNQKQLELFKQQEATMNNRHSETPQMIFERKKRQAFLLRQLNAKDALEDRGQIMIPKAEDLSINHLSRIESTMKVEEK